MARLTGKQRRENQSAAAKVRAEKRDKFIKEKNERIAANATGRTKAAQTKVTARLKIQNAGKTTSKKSTAASRMRAKNVAIHGEKNIAALEKRNKAFQESKKAGTHRKKKLTNAEKLRQRRGK